MKYILILLAIVSLYGCSETQMIRDKVAGAYDQVLEANEMGICNDVSVGSILRRYGKSAERAQAWRDFCFGDEAVHILTAPSEDGKVIK